MTIWQHFSFAFIIKLSNIGSKNFPNSSYKLKYYTPDSRITNASWLLKSFGNHIFYANHDIEYPNEDFFADQVNLVCEDT